MKALGLALERMFCLESLLALLFFSVIFYSLLELSLVISDNYSVPMWVISIFPALTIVIGLQEYCRELIGKLGNFSSEKVVLSVLHFRPFRTESTFTIQAFLFFALYKLTTLALGDLLPEYAIGFLFIFLLPASYTYMSLTGDAMGSINPVNLFRLIGELKVNYLFMLMFAGIAYISALNAVGAYMNPSFIFTVLSVATIIFCANYMGAAILHKHKVLGIADPEVTRQERQQEKSLHAFEGRVFQLVSGDNHDAALKLIEEELVTNPFVSDEYVQQYLRENAYTQVALRHADRYVSRLLESGKTMKAWSLVLFLLSESRKYYIEDLRQLKQLVDCAVSREQHEASITLLNRLKEAEETSENTRKILHKKALEISHQKL